MVRKTKKRPAMSPDPFLVHVVGSGNETSVYVCACVVYVVTVYVHVLMYVC